MDDRSTAKEDIGTERRVLAALLDAYPELFTEGELLWMLVNDLDHFGERDAAERAVYRLCGVGLLHTCGPLIIPSAAALRIKAMEDDEAS